MKKMMVAALGVLAPAAVEAQGVLTYHNSNDRHGAYVVPGLTASAAADLHLDPAFNARFPGHVYAQPLYWRPEHAASGLLIVATEQNAVLALNADSGAVVWRTQLPAPVALDTLPCGNIDPEGITGTPVIDPATGTLYLDALEQTADGPRHMVYGLSLADGKIAAGWPLDVQAALAAQGIVFKSMVQGERGALLLAHGALYIVYGGRDGDCGAYRGSVLQLHLPAPSVAGFWATRARGGGIWAQGGAAADQGDIFATSGNTFGASTWNDGEAILRLRPGLAHSASTADYFVPSNWKMLDRFDQDLGGTEALPLDIPVAGGPAAARVIAFGKDGNAYLADRGNLGGIGGQVAVASVSGSAVVTAPAVYSTAAATMVVFASTSGKGCGNDNLTMLDVAGTGASPISTAWCAASGGMGAPVVTTTDGASDPLVWAVGAEGDSLLHGFDALTGRSVFGGAGVAMTGLHHFQTLIAAQGRLYVAADGRVYSFTWAP